MTIAPWKILAGLVAFLLLVAVAGAFLLKDRSQRVGVDAFVLGMDEALPELDEDDLSTIAIADAATIAKTHHERGDAEAARAIFEQLDTLGRLDADGLQTLAHYQGEVGDFPARYRTLARLVDDGLTQQDTRAVLGYFDATGMGADRLALLERLDQTGQAKTEDRVQLMRIYRHMGRSDDALRVLKSLLSSDIGETGVDDMRTLIRLMERSDRAGEIPDLLENWIRNPEPMNVMRARLALLAELEQTELVVQHAAPWRREDPTIERLFDYGLYVLRDEPDYADTYTERLLERLSDPDSRGVPMMSLIHEVFDRMPADEAMAQLSNVAPGDGDVVASVYLDRLVKAGRTDEAGEMVYAAFENTGLDFSARERLVKQIVAVGDLDRAEMAYKQMATRYGATNSVINGLRYVWDRQGKDQDVNWLGERYLSSSAAQRSGWKEAFLAAGEPGELLDWLSRNDPRARPDRDTAHTRVTLALWEEGAPRLERELNVALSAEALTEEDVAGFLKAACENGHAGAASQALTAYETIAEPNPAGRLCLARLTPENAPARLAVFRYTSAETAGAQFTASDLLRYADVTRDTMGRRAATPLYQRALDQLPPLPESTTQQALLRGYVEMDLGNRQRAAEAFETVLERDGGASDPEMLKLLLQIYTDDKDFEAVLRLTEQFKDSGALPPRDGIAPLD